MPEKTFTSQKDPPEGDRGTIERELERADRKGEPKSPGKATPSPEKQPRAS
jgi:hypothetical protein